MARFKPAPTAPDSQAETPFMRETLDDIAAAGHMVMRLNRDQHKGDLNRWRFIPPAGYELPAGHAHLAGKWLHKGVPDAVIGVAGGGTVWLEFKRLDGKGKFSVEQEYFRDAMIALGHDWRLVDSRRDVADLIKPAGLTMEMFLAINF